jgi:hypothetical protein
MTCESSGVVGCSTVNLAGFAPYPLPERLFAGEMVVMRLGGVHNYKFVAV